MEALLPVRPVSPGLCAAEAARLALKSMLFEVDLSPKPGLVDALDTGAHSDMNRELFYRSAYTLEPWFEKIFTTAPRGADPAPVLPAIRKTGVKAEQAMYEATGGINTHKGQIFILGVTLAAARRRAGGNTLSILDEVSSICRGICSELTCIKPESGEESQTHGERIFSLFGSYGIRGEAEAGFPSVRYRALPRWKELLKRGCTMEEAALEALVVLMSRVQDSTVLYRSGMEGLLAMKAEACDFLEAGGIQTPSAISRLKKMNSSFVSLNISPGGCADLLALTRFLLYIEESSGGQNCSEM